MRLALTGIAGLWAIAWAFKRSGFVSLQNMDLSEIHLIELEREEEKQAALMEEQKEAKSWWRKWLI